MKLKSKLFASAVAFTMVLSMVAVPVSAQTTAELTAQINSLLAMIAQLQAQIAGGAGAGSSTTFTTDLTIGSKGADVTALQTWLVGKGFLTMPAGVAMGYFGSLTQAAVAKYQVSAGITPAVGYFGPKTRAAVNALAATGTGTGTGTGSTSGVGITTPGVEGTLTVTNSTAGLVSTAHVGDSKVAILGFKAEAKTSDIAIQRVKIDLGDSTKVYNKIYSKVYITDADGNVLASSDLNSNTVVKEGSTYFVTLSGFTYVVPKNTTKQLYVKADLYSSIDSTDITAWNLINTIELASNGVRGVDGAGIDQYSPSTGSDVTKAVTVASSLSDSATLKLSLNSATPKAANVIASNGSDNNELDKLTLLTFDLKAEKDSIKVTDMKVGVVDSGSGAATAATAYLYDGSTELDNASIANNQASFSNLDYVVPQDTTKTLTVKVDIRTANGTIENFYGIASTTKAVDLQAENSIGDSVTPTGSATGNTIGVRNAGPEFTLNSKPTITTTGTPQGSGSNANATSTLVATFNVHVKAVGASLLLGTIGSSTPMFEFSGAGTTSFVVYKNGVVSSANTGATSTAYTIPSTCVADTTNKACTLADGSETDISVTYQIPGRVAAGTALTSGLYSVGLEKINWGNAQAETFMSGSTDWRTADVSFP
jgi:hypothetical protein